jgi:hypothetical protein
MHWSWWSFGIGYAVFAAQFFLAALVGRWFAAREEQRTEEGRRLASQREDLIARGVNPDDLEKPL